MAENALRTRAWTHSIRALRQRRALVWRRRGGRHPAPSWPPAARITRYVDADGDFEAEISSLRATPARSPRRHWSGAQLGAGTLSRGERLRRAAFVCVLLGLALLGATGNGPTLLALLSGPQVVAGAPLPQTLAQSGGIVCLRDDAWAPDSRSFAYAGNASQSCGYGQYAPNVIDVYRARDDALVRQLTPDAAIFAALGRPTPPASQSGASPAPGAAFLIYDFLLWSHDGRSFAVVFRLGDSRQVTPGVAVLRASDGRVQRVVLGKSLPDSVSATSYAIWDLAAGTATAYPDPGIGQPGGVPSPAPALRYAWTDKGQLAAAAAAPAGLESIGDPSGDATFSIWQSGTLQLGLTNVPDRHELEAVYEFDTQVAAWSPNGRFIAAYVAIHGRLQPSHGLSPDGEALRLLLAADLPLLPLRDAGLEEALRRVRTPMDADANGDQSFGWIAYRPDGRALALFDDQQDVAVYGAATGAQLSPPRQMDLLVNPHNETSGAMRWSPDGTMLLLPDGSVLRIGRSAGCC